MIEIEGPDGSINEFPDGTPDAVISKAMATQFGAPAPGKATDTGQPAPGLRDRAAGAVSSVTGTVARALGLDTGPSPYQQSSDLDAQMRGVPAAPATAKRQGAEDPEGGGTRREGILPAAFGVVDQGVRGVAKGVATVAGLPFDAQAALANITPGMSQLRQAMGLPAYVTNPVLGSASLKGALDTANDATIGAINQAAGVNLDLPVRQGDNILERGADRIGQELGAAAVPGIGAAYAVSPGRLALKAAMAGEEAVPTAMEAARGMNPLAAHFTEQAAASTPKFLRKEASIAGAAGGGAAVADEAARAAGADEHSGGYVAADLAGALAGATGLGVAKHAVSKAGDIAGAMTNSPRMISGMAREEAASRLAEAADAPQVRVGGKDVYDTSPVADAVRRGMKGEQIADTVPGYKDTLADTLRDPQVAQLEYGRRGGGSATVNRQATANEEAVNRAIDAQAPEGNPGAMRASLADRRTELQQGAREDTNAAQQRFEEANDRLRTVMEQDARGANIRAALDDAKRAARAVEEQAWHGVADGETDMRPLAERFRNVQAGLSTAERRTLEPQELTSIPEGHVPPAAPAEGGGLPRGLLDGMDDEERAMAERLMGNNQVGAHPAETGAAPQPATVPLREVTGLRSSLSGAAREARSAGNDNKARVIERFIDAIDDHAASGGHPNLDAYNRAREVSVDLNNRFTRPQTDVAQVLHETQNQYRTPHSDVAPRFVRPNTGDQGGFEALMREAGNDPRARGAVEDQIRARANEARTPEAVDRFMQEHSRVLDQFPDLRGQIAERSSAQNAARGAERRSAELDATLGTENTRGSSPVGKYLHQGPENTSKAVKGLFGEAKPGDAARELVEFTGHDPEAVAGLRRAIWDEAEGVSRRKGETTANAAGVQPWMPAKLRAFMDKPNVRAVMEQVYPKEHLDNIDKLTEVLQRANTGGRGKVGNTSGTAQGIMGAISKAVPLESLQSDYKSYKRGAMGGDYLVTSIIARVARNVVKNAHQPAVNRVLDEALMDPKAAEALLRENNPANRAYLRRFSKLWGVDVADKLAANLSDEPDDPVKNALKRSAR